MRENKGSVWGRVAKRGKVFPHQLAFTLLVPLRNIFLSPRKLVRRLELRRDHRVLEVGCGPGYFAPAVARAIPDGRLVLTDIQPEMLAMARKRLARRGIPNVEYHLCDGVGFPSFPDNEFDTIYMVTVLGEVENKPVYIREFHRMLRPGGLLSISEQAGDADKMSVAEIKNLLHGSGLIFDRLHGAKNNFTINFRKTVVRG